MWKHTHTHTRTHARAHTHTHTHTHLSYLLYISLVVYSLYIIAECKKKILSQLIEQLLSMTRTNVYSFISECLQAFNVYEHLRAPIQHRKIAEIFHCEIALLQKRCKTLLQYYSNIATIIKCPKFILGQCKSSCWFFAIFFIIIKNLCDIN